MNATKIKRKRIYPGNTRPPGDIRENTKERRAWLANRLAEIQSVTSLNLEAKIIGKGSYQEIAVWELSEVVGRIRQRGHCEFCGHEQVVKRQMLVLHGYESPGIGYVFNRCPGTELPPLEISDSLTRTWLMDAKRQAAEAKNVLDLCQTSFNEKLELMYGESGIGDAKRLQAISTKPVTPPKGNLMLERQYEWAMNVWSIQNPEYVSYLNASKALHNAKHMKWLADAKVSHFQELLARELLGKPLKKEVVA